MQQAHKKIAECEGFLFSFFILHLLKGAMEEGSWGWGQSYKLASQFDHEFVSDLFLRDYVSLKLCFQTGKIRKISMFPLFIKLL